MPEIPEHLLKRSAERRKQLGLPTGEEGESAEAAAPEGGEAEAPAEVETAAAAERRGRHRRRGHRGQGRRSRPPARTLPPPQGCARRVVSGDAATPAAAAGGTATATAVKAAPAPTMTGPGGHTQRLLTVVKSGSIQQTRAEAQDKVHTWPHLLVVEFAAILAMTAVVLVFSAIVRAPLLGLADVNQTPNPSKAPWYFLGLQELLTMFHPMVAGVTIPGMGLFLLIVAPVHRQEPVQQAQRPEVRDLHLHDLPDVLAVLVIIGSFFRGSGIQLRVPLERRHLLRAVGADFRVHRPHHRHPGPVDPGGRDDLRHRPQAGHLRPRGSGHRDPQRGDPPDRPEPGRRRRGRRRVDRGARACGRHPQGDRLGSGPRRRRGARPPSWSGRRSTRRRSASAGASSSTGASSSRWRSASARSGPRRSASSTPPPPAASVAASTPVPPSPPSRRTGPDKKAPYYVPEARTWLCPTRRPT